jgi:putative transcriptional regulator
MIDRPEVGPLIRELRHRMGLTQEKLAARLGVSLQTINRWENDRASASPSSSTMQRIKQALHELGSRGEDLLAKYFPNER